MASHGRRGMTDPEIYNDSPTVQPTNKIWCLNGKLYKYKARDRAGNLVYLIDMHEQKTVSLLWSDFIARREPVYSVSKVADLLNRHHTWLKREIWHGTFKQPVYATPDGKAARMKQGYYTQKDVYEMREVMVERRKRKADGIAWQMGHIPTEQELTHRMGRGMLTYTRLGDGRFVPIWEETVL